MKSRRHRPKRCDSEFAARPALSDAGLRNALPMTEAEHKRRSERYAVFSYRLMRIQFRTMGCERINLASGVMPARRFFERDTALSRSRRRSNGSTTSAKVRISTCGSWISTALSLIDDSTAEGIERMKA